MLLNKKAQFEGEARRGFRRRRNNFFLRKNFVLLYVRIKKVENSLIVDARRHVAMLALLLPFLLAFFLRRGRGAIQYVLASPSRKAESSAK